MAGFAAVRAFRSGRATPGVETFSWEGQTKGRCEPGDFCRSRPAAFVRERSPAESFHELPLARKLEFSNVGLL